MTPTDYDRRENRLTRRFRMTDALRQHIQKFIYGTLATVSVFALVFATLLAPHVSADAGEIETPRDCDTNAVLSCGGSSAAEIATKYNASSDAQTIYTHFGITKWNIENLSKNAVAGKVTQGGRVLVNGKEVATGVVTTGRINMAGSTAVTKDGVTFYVRPPSASFQQPSLPAFVVLNKDGTMKHAIIASCGNPVMTVAKPVPEKPKPEAEKKPAPQAAAPVATAVAINNVTVQQQQQQQQQQTPPAPQPQPVAPTPVVVTPTITPVATLPKTGAAEVIQLAALTALGGTFAHMLYSRRKNRNLDI